MPNNAAIGPATTSCKHCPLRTNESFNAFTGTELAFVEKFKIGELRLEADTNILLEGAKSPHLYTLLRGWAYRHSSLPNGRRQVLNFGLPGDFMGLQMSVLGEMEHTVTALTDVTLCVFDRERLWDLFKSHAELSYALTWMAAREEMILDGHVLALGQRPAAERLGYMLLHLYDRAAQVELAGNNTMEAPFTQAQIADALGLTPIHTSRSIKRLEREGYIRWRRPILQFIDRDGLRAFVGDMPKLPQTRRFI